MKKFLILFVCFILVGGSIVFFPFDQHAEAKKKTTLSEKIDQEISEWVLDEERGYLYAISKENNQLLFISVSSLKIEKQFTIGANPSDIVLDKNKLYIALSGSTAVAVVDVERQAKEKALTTSQKPLELAIDGEYLFYISSSNDSDDGSIFVYNISSSKEKKLKHRVGNPDIAIDTKNHILYAGESGISGGNVSAISTKNYTFLHKTTYNEGYGFPYPLRKVLFDGNSVYYAGSRLNSCDLSSIEGSFAEFIIYAKDRYVFSKTSVYDRDTFIRLMDLPVDKEIISNGNVDIKVVMDDSKNIILYDPSEEHLVKVPLKESIPKTQYKKGKNKISFGEGITDWAYDDKRDVIYAIQINTNKLLFIDSRKLTVIDELIIGSRPSDIEYFQNTLFIALNGGTKVAKVNLQNKNKVELLEVKQIPNKLVVFDHYFSTIGDENWEYLYSYLFIIERSIRASETTFHSTQYLVADKRFGTLYLVDDFNMYVINPISGKIEEVVDGSGRVVINGDDLFFRKNRLDKYNLNITKGTYDEEIIFVNEDYAFSTKTVFDKDSYTKSFELPFEVRDIHLNNDGAIFLYSEKDKTIHRYDSIQSLRKTQK
ncbi:hypothetical protein [Brevibacillus sp. SYSU BS000544]|uniref:hypothetical protein n=1 Tax=Brevibacillus sp. SYSU BS000544 TaxID=3416443 RepID=UPI003CE493DB